MYILDKTASFHIEETAQITDQVAQIWLIRLLQRLFRQFYM